MLSSAQNLCDDVQSEGDRGRIGEDRSESVMLLILISVNLGKESSLRSKGAFRSYCCSVIRVIEL